MSTTININPIAKFWHQKTDRDWSTARDANESDSFSDLESGRIGIVLPDSDYIFFRLYLSFDLSEIPVGSTIDSITLSLTRVDELKDIYSPIIAYAGVTSLNGDITEYPWYLDNINLDNDPLATIDIEDNTQYYTSTNFNTNYTVSPGDILTVGVIDSDDFSNRRDSISDVYLISFVRGNEPRLNITYTEGGGGYPNLVMGVNISTVAGVPSANIANIMGV